MDTKESASLKDVCIGKNLVSQENHVFSLFQSHLCEWKKAFFKNCSRLTCYKIRYRNTHIFESKDEIKFQCHIVKWIFKIFKREKEILENTIKSTEFWSITCLP